MRHGHTLFAAVTLTLLAGFLISCGSSNLNNFRYLVFIAVTPATADAQSYPNGQVQFTATGTFSEPPISAPVPSSAPYSGQFSVVNPVTGTVATIVSSGSGTVTVQCASGVSGTVPVSIIASANNGTSTTISGSGQLTCP